MNIVYCHIDYSAAGRGKADRYSFNSLPDYALHSVLQSRFASPASQQFFICNYRNLSGGMRSRLERLGVTIVEQDSLMSDKVAEATAAYFATNFDRRLGNFNYTGVIRYFFVEELMKAVNLSNVFYMEYDNLLYEDPDKIPAEYFAGDYIIPKVNNRAVCAGVAFFRTYDALARVNRSVIGLMKSKPAMYIRDMELISSAARGLAGVCFADCVPGSDEYIFDPCSFGQFLYGTNNGARPGFIDMSHDCGAYIYRNLRGIKFSKDKRGFTMSSAGHLYKLVNLHIHNKRAIEKAVTYNEYNV